LQTIARQWLQLVPGSRDLVVHKQPGHLLRSTGKTPGKYPNWQ
jgi:hypothetical protein